MYPAVSTQMTIMRYIILRFIALTMERHLPIHTYQSNTLSKISPMEYSLRKVKIQCFSAIQRHSDNCCVADPAGPPTAVQLSMRYNIFAYADITCRR